ncbi:protein prenylyltransferase [Lichtheimia hyalospora FSU 10163]|nr:protein prenylyltransferase [Lichtheimia hyalospora FSU 10163]
MLYQKLNTVLSTYAINEIGFVHATPNADELPGDSQEFLPLVVVDSKLGFPLPHLPTLLKEADHALRTATTFNEKANTSKIMVLLKPDHYTAMNTRKQLMMENHINVKDEIELIDLIFTLPRHSKSCIAWHHRRWLHAQWPDKMDLEKELSLCERTATLHPRNYYAWNYRGWLLDQFITAPEDQHSEYCRTRTWIERNVSDHSGIHHMARVMQAIGKANKDTHMDWIDDLIIRFPGHEALWCHRRFCVTFFSLDGHGFVDKAIAAAQETCCNDQDLMDMQMELAIRYGIWLCLMVRNIGMGM